MGKRCPDGCTCKRHHGKSFDPYSYENNHIRMRRTLGKATEHDCVSCGGPAEHWAQIHGTVGSDPWSDYTPLCVACHHSYDQNGWEHLTQQGKVNIVGSKVPPGVREKMSEGQKRNYALNGYAEDRKDKQRAAALKRSRDLWCDECGAGPFQKSGLGAHVKYRHTDFKRGAA